MGNANDYSISGERVGALGWGDDEIEEPTWVDVVTKLNELANGEHKLVTLQLEPAFTPGEQPPTLFAVRGAGGDGGLEVFFRSAEHSLNTGRDSYSRDEVERIFKHFHDELELDPAEDWESD